MRVLSVVALLAMGVGCGWGGEGKNKEKQPDDAPPVETKADDPAVKRAAEVGGIAAEVAANPTTIDEILAKHSLTREAFVDEVSRIAEVPAQSRAFDKARRGR